MLVIIEYNLSAWSKFQTTRYVITIIIMNLEGVHKQLMYPILRAYETWKTSGLYEMYQEGSGGNFIARYIVVCVLRVLLR
jgi:hypothetical protein